MADLVGSVACPWRPCRMPRCPPSPGSKGRADRPIAQWQPDPDGAAAAVLTGARSFAAIAEWAADTPQPIRAALGARHDPLAAASWSPPRPPSAVPSAGWTPTPWPPQWATGWSHATATTTPPPRSGHGSGRWPSMARRCAAPTHPTATAAPSTCWRRWSTPAASCWQPAGCLLSQPVTRPAQALVTAALWRRDSPPAFRRGVDDAGVGAVPARADLDLQA
jgi:hypothetical protein